MNLVWNFSNELSLKVWERERRLLSGYDFRPFTKGAGKAGLGLHSPTIQVIGEEYAVRRKPGILAMGCRRLAVEISVF